MEMRSAPLSPLFLYSMHQTPPCTNNMDEFDFKASTMSFADDIFEHGSSILPLKLKLPPRLQVATVVIDRRCRLRSSLLKISPLSKLVTPRTNDFDPFAVALETVRKEEVGGRRRARSLSPPRSSTRLNSALIIEEDQREALWKGSKRRRRLKDFLFRSCTHGGADAGKSSSKLRSHDELDDAECSIRHESSADGRVRNVVMKWMKKKPLLHHPYSFLVCFGIGNL